MATVTATISQIPPARVSDDIELSPVPVFSQTMDPYSLQSKLTQLSTLRQRRRKVRKFYEDQNANIERMLKSVDEHRLDADAAHAEKLLKVSPSTLFFARGRGG
jgi:hypothetical protein